MKKTKIIATIGPASKEEKILKEMLIKGMDIARINMIHADYEFCDDVIKKVRKLNQELSKNVAIMIDLKGPDVTVNRFNGGHALLTTGDKIRIYKENIMGDSTKFSTSYPELINEVKIDNIIKLNDGLIELRVDELRNDCIICEVVVGGVISDNKGVNVVGTKLNIPFLSEKDKKDIAYASKVKADILALSFISSSEEVLQVNDMLIELDNDNLSIVSKIENERALNELDDIIRVSDGIIVARGDLGVELPLERIPGIQKNIINKCHRVGKVSIVATEMLSSMEESSRPTRAEVSDVANAVLDGVDAVVLTGETTVGKYPINTLSMMSKIIEASEMDINYYQLLDEAMRTEKQDITGSISFSVVDCANRLKCQAIVAPTMSGYTAKKISRFRPSCPIIAITPNKNTIMNLSMHYGIYTVYSDDLNSFDKMMSIAKKISKQMLNVADGDRIIITGGYPFKEVKHTNFMKIEEL